MAGLDEAELERLAQEELLKEAKRGKARAETMGAMGWQSCPLPPTNKRFLHNMVVSTFEPRKKKQREEGTVKREQQTRQKGRESHTYSEKTKSENDRVEFPNYSKAKQRDLYTKRDDYHSKGRGSQTEHSAHWKSNGSSWNRIVDPHNRQNKAKHVSSRNKQCSSQSKYAALQVGINNYDHLNKQDSDKERSHDSQTKYSPVVNRKGHKSENKRRYGDKETSKMHGDSQKTKNDSPKNYEDVVLPSLLNSQSEPSGLHDCLEDLQTKNSEYLNRSNGPDNLQSKSEDLTTDSTDLSRENKKDNSSNRSRITEQAESHKHKHKHKHKCKHKHKHRNNEKKEKLLTSC